MSHLDDLHGHAEREDERMSAEGRESEVEALAEVLKAHSVYASGSDLTYPPGDSRRYLDDGCTCGWRGPWGSRFRHQAKVILAAHLTDVEARLKAVEAEHRVIHQAGAELVCFCGAHLSVYGLTRSLAAVFAQHVREARPLYPDPSEPTPPEKAV